MHKASSTVSNLRNAATAGGPVPSPDSINPQPVVHPSPGVTGPPPRPPKPIRFTLDLRPEPHRWLKVFAAEAEVDASVVMRALLDELAADSELAQRVRERAWAQLS